MKSPRRQPASDPAWAIATLAVVAAAAIVVAVSFQIFDTDLWQHLVRGKAIFTLHAIPTRNLWTWPVYGMAEKGNAAWAFAALIWPIWAAFGVTGLFVWRWVMALAVFAVAWAIARRLGARGSSTLVVLVACAMIYRPRSQVRPETLAALLLLLQLWILETRRSGGRDLALALVPIAWLWPNLHTSYFIGWLVVGLFGVAERWESPPPASPRRVNLVVVLALMVAVTFLNPLGLEVFRLPVEFFTRLRREPLYQSIGELKPIDWSINWLNGLPLLMVAWPALAIRRWARGRRDVAEAGLCVLFTIWALSSQRFLTFWALVAAPYLARDLTEALAARGARPRTSFGLRVGASALGCVALVALEMTRAPFPMGIGIEPHSIPAAACDFIAREGVRGRGFNYFEQGGYLAWRFWPERSRLPFMTTAPELATPAMRLEYQRAMVFPQDWRAMDGHYGFDWVLLRRSREPGDRYLEFLDTDSSFALVWVDDVSALYLKRLGPLASVADRWMYRRLCGDPGWMEGAPPDSTPGAAAELARELDRAIAAAPLHATLAAARERMRAAEAGAR